MTKKKEELNKLKNEYKRINKRLKELSNDELIFVIGASLLSIQMIMKKKKYMNMVLKKIS